MIPFLVTIVVEHYAAETADYERADIEGDRVFPGIEVEAESLLDLYAECDEDWARGRLMLETWEDILTDRLPDDWALNDELTVRMFPTGIALSYLSN